MISHLITRIRRVLCDLDLHRWQRRHGTRHYHLECDVPGCRTRIILFNANREAVVHPCLPTWMNDPTVQLIDRRMAQ